MSLATRRKFLEKGTSAVVVAATAGLIGMTGPAGATPLIQGTPYADRLGWQIGFSAYTFRAMSLFETLERIASVGLRYTELFAWQKLGPKNPDARPDPDLSSSLRKDLKNRASDSGVKIVACYADLKNAVRAKQFFEFAAEMGFEAIVAEPPEELLDAIERLTEEFHVDLALHNHPKPSRYWNPETGLKALASRGGRMGFCCDTGHWCRSGLDPVEVLRKIGPRAKRFHLKDLDAFDVPGAKDVVWGEGKGRIAELLTEVKRQGLKPYFGIEWERTADSEASIHAASVARSEKIAEELAGR